MSYQTLEVELENGRVHPFGSETLPDNAIGLLTILSVSAPGPAEKGGGTKTTLNTVPDVARTCAELAARWQEMEKLPLDEAIAFADDIEHARGTLPPLKSAWD